MSPSFTHKSIKRFAQFRANEPRFFLTHVSHGHSPIRSLPRWPMYNEILSVASLKAAVAAARSTGARLRVVRCAWLTEACQNRCAQGMFLRTGRLTGGDGKCRTGKRWTKHQRQKKNDRTGRKVNVSRQIFALLQSFLQHRCSFSHFTAVQHFLTLPTIED